MTQELTGSTRIRLSQISGIVQDDMPHKELRHIEYDTSSGKHVEYDRLCNVDEDDPGKSKEKNHRDKDKVNTKGLNPDFDIAKNILVNGNNETVKNKYVGEILIEPGTTGQSGYGIKHIIEQRAIKNGRSEEDITALLILIIEAAKNGEITRNVKVESKGHDIGTLYLEKDGIVAFVSKSKNGTGQKFVISGWDDDTKKEEATDAINAVIADDSYTPDFVIVKKQVGAVLSSLKKITQDKAIVNTLDELFLLMKGA